jgi:hypothetical protein
MVSPAPGVAETVTVPAPHREALPADGAEGFSLTVTTTWSLTEQPAEVAVRVYVVVTDGVAVGPAMFVALKPSAGDQL